nr:carbohydrate ABC transporter permease [Ruminococcus sp.]
MTREQKRHTFNIIIMLFTGLAAVLFLMPTVLTIANSFMTTNEIAANYGSMFSNMTDAQKTFISEDVNLKFIPDKVTFSQYSSVLLKSPDYLLKFWNSVMLTVPITVFQILLAVFTAYGFSRYPSKFKSIIFFAYIILMIMPYQVTLVPNYLVEDKI